MEHHRVRKIWVFVGLAALALTAGCGFADPDQGVQGPKGDDAPVLGAQPANVLFIVIDTIRADRMSFLGCDRETTPRLDELAEQSWVFERAYATAPWTVPAIGSMFTGHHPRTLGIEDEAVAIPEKIATLPEIFDASGYNTVGIVSHIYVGAKYGFARGFDFFDAEEARGRDHISSPGVTRRAATALMELGKRQEPFFLFVHYFDPHYNYFEHEGFAYSKDYEGPFHSGLSYKRMRGMFAKGAADADDRDYLGDVYDSEVAFTDHHIGRLLDRLEELGMFDETLVVVAGDHGEELADYADGWVGHTKRLTNELIHVPFLMKNPGQKIERRIKRPISMVDVTPTIARQAGLRHGTAKGVYGRPVALRGTRGSLERPILSETRRWARMQAIVTRDWKLVRDEAHGTYGLYHLPTDPSAVRDVFKEQPDRAAYLQAQLGLWDRMSADLEAKMPNNTAAKPQLSPRELEQLRELGYMSEDDGD